MAAKKRRKRKSRAAKRLYEMGKWYDRKTGVVHEGPGTWVYRPGSSGPEKDFFIPKGKRFKVPR